MPKTGFIAILGRPNVGKSTLLNSIIGDKVSIVSSKPHTTRTGITGILTKGECQFVFTDTPGIQTPRNKLGNYMLDSVYSAMRNVDAAVLVVTSGRHPGKIEKDILKKLSVRKIPVVLAINKTDLSDAIGVGETIKEYNELFTFHSIVPVSARKKDGVSIILDEIEGILEDGEFLFPEDIITDQPERFFISEIVREKILKVTNDEVPHGVAVVIEDFKENSKRVVIAAHIYCEKEAHKRILVGKKGDKMKTIGTYAREDLVKYFDKPVYLDLWVKTRENWRDDQESLYNFGYDKRDFD